MPDEPEALGLLALMLLHDSRRDDARRRGRRAGPARGPGPSRWDTAEIAEGRELVERALRLRRAGPYQLQAAIAALHTEPTATTDWPQIVALYGELERLAPSPVVELNRAAAVAMADGPEHGLEQIDRDRGPRRLRLVPRRARRPPAAARPATTRRRPRTSARSALAPDGPERRYLAAPARRAASGSTDTFRA